MCSCNPGSLAIYDDQLLIFGRLEEQAHGCLSQFARSDDGLSWSIDNRGPAERTTFPMSRQFRTDW